MKVQKLFSKMKTKKGQGIIEYGFILMLVALTVFAGLSTLGLQLSDFFTFFSSLIPKPT